MKALKVNNLVRVLIGLLLSAVSGLAFLFAFPPYGAWFLIFIGWIPVLIAQHRIMPRKLSCLAPSVALFVWLQGYLGQVFAPIPTFMRYLPAMIFVISIFLELGTRSFNEKTHYRWFVLSGVISWVGFEMIRLFIPIAGTWAFVAYPLYLQTWFIQPVSIFGILGLDALILFINFAFALGLMRLFDRQWQFADLTAPVDGRLARRWTLAISIALVAWMIISLVQFNTAEPANTIKVAAIQPDVSPIITANAGEAERLDDVHQAMIAETRAAAAQGAQLVVWPEGSFLFDPQVEDKLGLVQLAKDEGIYLAVGYIVVQEDNTMRNEATVITPEGEFLGVYGKDHPVTFGGETSVSRGTYPVYDTEIAKIATIICYDQDYTDTTQKVVRNGAQLIAVPSNDWTTIGDKHFTHTVFRAVENQVAVVKADGGYDSVLVNPNGEIISLASCTEGCGATLVGDVQLGSGEGTLTTHLGDWVGWIALAGLAFFTFFSGMLVKQAEKHDNPKKVEVNK